MRNSSTEFLRLNFIWVTFFFPRCVRNNNINTDNSGAPPAREARAWAEPHSQGNVVIYPSQKIW